MTYIKCPYCGKSVIMDWKCSECKKEIAYDIDNNLIRSNPHKKERKDNENHTRTV